MYLKYVILFIWPLNHLYLVLAIKSIIIDAVRFDEAAAAAVATIESTPTNYPTAIINNSVPIHSHHQQQ